MDAKEFFYEFGRALYQIDGYYNEFAKKCKVKAKLLWVLYALNDGKKHTQKEISTTWELPRTTVNTVVKELEESGYVVLSPIKGEKREMLVSLTESGKQYAREKLSDLYKIEQNAFDNMDDETKKVIQNLENILKELNQGMK